MSSSAGPADGGMNYGKVFALLLGASALFRLLYSPAVPLTGDELMHWEWSRHLDLGYPEHPPLIAWLLALTTGIFGHHPAAVRLVPVLAMTGTFALSFRLGRELFGERAAFWGVVPMMSTPLFNAGGVLANTDSLLGCFWTLTLFGVKRAVLDGSRRAWLWVGCSTGLCLLSKLPAVFLFPATAIVLLGTAEGRRWVRRWEPWAAAALAWVFFLPPLIWNARHGWFTISMRVGHQTAGGFTLKYFGELIGAQLLIVSPLLFVWLLWGLWTCWRRRTDSRAVLLGTFMAVPFGFYVIYSFFARSGVHWPAVGYPAGFLAAGAFTATLPGLRIGKRFVATGMVLALMLTAVLFVVPLIPDKLSFSWAYPGRPEKVSSARLDDIVDWNQLGRPVSAAIEQSPGPTFVMARYSYALAGVLAFYTPEHPQVFLWEPAFRNGAAYELWKQQTDVRGWNAVIVEEGLNQAWFGTMRGAFESMSEPQRVDIERGGVVLHEYYLIRAAGFKGFPEPRR